MTRVFSYTDLYYVLLLLYEHCVLDARFFNSAEFNKKENYIASFFFHSSLKY